MTWNNVYLSTPQPTGNDARSAGTTVFSDISTGDVTASTLSTAGAVTMQGAVTVNATVTADNLTTAGTATAGLVSATSISLATLAGSGITAGSSTPDGVLWITVGASGLSLGIESGGSLYFINSTVSAA